MQPLQLLRNISVPGSRPRQPKSQLRTISSPSRVPDSDEPPHSQPRPWSSGMMYFLEEPPAPKAVRGARRPTPWQAARRRVPTGLHIACCFVYTHIVRKGEFEAWTGLWVGKRQHQDCPKHQRASNQQSFLGTFIARTSSCLPSYQKSETEACDTANWSRDKRSAIYSMTHHGFFSGCINSFAAPVAGIDTAFVRRPQGIPRALKQLL